VLTLHGTSDGTNFYNGCPAGDTVCSRNGEWVESVESALADFRVTNGCGGEPELEMLEDGVEHRSWKTCTSGTEIEFYKVPDGQHVWWLLPETTDIVTDFLLAH
jgi:poly(3-hydroxybutyrate) depolymerase